MISFSELSKKSKSQIRSNNELAEAFEFYFLEKFNLKPSFCCTFSDYKKLFNNFKNIEMTNFEKYTVNYAPDTVLAYRVGKSTKRFKVKNATDKLIAEFLKHHNKNKYPNAKKRIVLIENPVKKKPTPKKAKNAPVKEKPSTFEKIKDEQVEQK